MSKFDYTLDDVERLRSAVETSYFVAIPPGHMSAAYYPAERTAEIEQRVRTYMAAGIRAEEVEAKNREISRQAIEWSKQT